MRSPKTEWYRPTDQAERRSSTARPKTTTKRSVQECQNWKHPIEKGLQLHHRKMGRGPNLSRKSSLRKPNQTRLNMGPHRDHAGQVERSQVPTHKSRCREALWSGCRIANIQKTGHAAAVQKNPGHPLAAQLIRERSDTGEATPCHLRNSQQKQLEGDVGRKRRPKPRLPRGRLDNMSQFLIHLLNFESMAMARKTPTAPVPL